MGKVTEPVKTDEGQQIHRLSLQKANSYSVNIFRIAVLCVRKVSHSYPELLNQVHVGSLVLLHAPLGDTGHVGGQRAVN